MANVKTMKSVLQERVTKRIEKGQAIAVKTLDQIQKESAGLNDFMGYLGKNGNVGFHSNGTLKVVLDKNKFSINPHAVAQTGGRMGVPTKYIKDLALGQEKWERDLAANILNEHMGHTDRHKVLIRTVDDEVRGVMSDRYKRMNTLEIYGQFLDATNKQGAVVVDAHLTPIKSYVETIIPKLVPVVTENNGTIYVVFGARIQNSDFGAGSLEVRNFMIQAVCLNGMVTNSPLKRKHVGSRISDDITFSERTVQLETKAQASIVNDLVTDLLSTSGIKKQISNIQDSSAKKMDMQKELLKLPKMGIQKGEVDLIGKVLMDNNESDGVAGTGSAWKLSQAITAVARDSDATRRRDLEEIGGSFIAPKKKKK
ncbi:hypothetical protein N8508_00280 [bacterium]|nr:hypothetical protein [bacterium]